MKTKVFFEIAIRIIILFTVSMFATFIPDYLQDFFNDTVHHCGDNPNCYKTEGYIVWGVRHIWYTWMVVLLFLLALVNVGISIFNLVKKDYDIDKK